MTAVRFSKFVGAGNDFIIVDTARHRLNGLTRKWDAVSRSLCDRRLGIGADGLLVLEPSRRGSARMRVFNPDGSEAQMCGNGARCVARYLHGAGGRGRGARVTIETKAGVLSATVRGHRVAMRMTDPTELALGRSVTVAGKLVRFSRVNTGVPHVVVPVRALETVDVLRLGRALRFHPRFAPRGTNVNFMEADRKRPDQIRVRTYERGVEGETPACGTGVAAAAITYAFSRQARGGSDTRERRISVETRSGDVLTVSFRMVQSRNGVRVSEVVLEGPAHRVFDGAVMWPHHLAGSAAGGASRPSRGPRVGRGRPAADSQVAGWPARRDG